MQFIQSYGHDPSQIMRFTLPDEGGNHPLLIIVHGGYWKSSHTYQSYATMEIEQWVMESNLPVAVANVEYRRLSDSSDDLLGSRINWRSMAEDLRKALNYIQAQSKRLLIDSKRSCLLGHSAGGYLSAIATSEIDVSVPLEFLPDRLCFVSSILNLAEAGRISAPGQVSQPSQIAALLGGDNVEFACPQQVKPLSSDITLIHGSLDETVPVTHAIDYAERWPEHIRECTLLEGIDHFGMFAMKGWPEFSGRANRRDCIEQYILDAVSLG